MNIFFQSHHDSHRLQSHPIYRHPADTTPSLLPFSPIVTQIKKHVENLLKQPFNHVLIQHYRSGADYISEHSDKTIDIAHGSNIVNVSVGAQRTMTLRTKNDIGAARSSQRIILPHNSMLVMGLGTNKKWVHSIRHDNRPSQVKSPEELAFSGERISLTFRHIATFVDNERQLIWGQGARGKSKECAGRVVNGGEEAEKLIIAFGEENHKSNFDWEAFYGDGFDVLHFTVISHQK